MLFFMLQAVLKKTMPRVTRLFLNGICVNEILQNLFMKWTWFVSNEADTQSAYNKFHEVISTKYHACFPYRKIPKMYYKNKPWLSTALKESIKINKL